MSQFPEEPLASTAEGYYPIKVGQSLKDGHYKVLRKLGWGPRSTVWLASYPSDESSGSEYCVIKILTVSATQEERSRKQETVKALVAVKQRAGFYNLPNFYESFTESSAHGSHLCIATYSLFPSIEPTFRKLAPEKCLSVHTAKKIIASVTESLSYLHQQGFAHGAVTVDNFAFGISTIPEFFEPILARQPPVPSDPPIVLDGVEYPVVTSQPILHSNKWNDNRSAVADYNVNLNNLGHAQRCNSKARWNAKYHSSALRPPEVIFGTSYDQKVDIWMLGCATFLLLTGTSLFVEEDDAAHLARISALTGQSFDIDVWKKSPRYEALFLPSEELKNGPTSDFKSLEAMLRGSPRLADKDVGPAAEFIAKCLVLDPAQRPSATQLSEDVWLAKGFSCSCGSCVQ